MSETLLAILPGVTASFLAGAATGVGALPIFALQRVSVRTHDSMLGFGAGVMLAASFFSLLLPGLEVGAVRFGALGAAAAVAVGFLAGGAIFSVADRLLPHEHFRLGPEGGSPGRLRRIWLFVIAITIHNFPEGLAVGVGFGSGDRAGGLALAIGIGLQNMPEGLAVALALSTEGYRRGAAFLIALASGLVEPVGGLLGALVVNLSLAWLPWMMAFAAGAMIYVISDEIIPETHRQGYQKAATVSLMIGFTAMMLLDVALTPL